MVKVYAEGGGHRELNSALRQGFSSFLGKALGLQRPRVVMCGSRGETWDRFRCTDGASLLLVDAEAAVAPGHSAWEHLHATDGWSRPGWATDEHAHLMVQCMEAWFLADPDALAAHFGKDFNRGQLPNSTAIETIPKVEVYRGLTAATRDTRAGSYAKGRHSGDLLGAVDPARVRAASPYADKFILALRTALPG